MRQPGNRAKEDTASATGARVVRSAAWRAPRYPTTATPPGPNTVSRVTRFAGRDPGPSARVAGFLAHLRDNGLRVGVAETATALKALTHISAHDPEDARRALRTICAGCREDVESFDALFDAYWLNEGRVRQRIAPSPGPSKHMRSTQEGAGASGGTGALHSPDDGTDDGQASGDGEGKLIASRIANLMKKDLRDVVSPQDIRAATRIAERLGRAIRDRRSRRRKAAARGARIDFRRVVRRSLATGGEPLALPRRHRPDRPVRIVALCDVSGSMTLYAPVYLAFLAGLSHT
ncbi:MAG: VWA domain-containing protein, partial [Pseudomonadota bacterium]